MKKYSDEHLESVPHEYIWAVEKSIEMLETIDEDESDVDTCMSLIIEDHNPYFELTDGCDELYGIWCPKYLGYPEDDGNNMCPCWRYGKEKSIVVMKNLVKQWKAWAGVE